MAPGRTVNLTLLPVKRGCYRRIPLRTTRWIGNASLAALPYNCGILHQTLLYLGRPKDALRIVDELEPLARKIAGIISRPRRCSQARRVLDEIGKAPDLAKLEAGLEQVLRNPASLRSRASGKPSFKAQLSLLDFFRGDWGRCPVAWRRRRVAMKLASALVEGIGVGTLFSTGGLCRRSGWCALAILDEKRSLIPRSGQHNRGGSWWMLTNVIEGLVMLGEQSQAAQLYPLACELLGTGAVTLWGISRFTQTIAGLAAGPVGSG